MCLTTNVSTVIIMVTVTVQWQPSFQISLFIFLYFYNYFQYLGATNTCTMAVTEKIKIIHKIQSFSTWIVGNMTVAKISFQQIVPG